jgi:OOP family OmpA-OmpF porin
MMKKIALTTVLAMCVTAHGAMPSLAQVNPAYVAEMNRDQPGAGDHPLVGRYGGSKLLSQTVKAFDELRLPSGAAEGQPWDNNKRFSQVLTVEGKVTRSIYVAPTGRSTLEVFVNLRDALAARDFAPVFECARETCGAAFPALKYAWDNKAALVLPDKIDARRKALVDAMFDRTKDIRYALMKKDTQQGPVYVAVYVGLNEGGTFGDISASLNGWPAALVEVVEPKAMERRIETIAAPEIGKTLSAQGRIAFYGIFFDFDRAEIRPESEPQLAEMARYLTENPAQRVFIIGHTDNRGQLTYNVGLSERRAQAVVAALTARHGIASQRLTARGLGPLSPLASNRSEEGQAKNRRVELVEQ